MNRIIGLSIGRYQKAFGDAKALEIAAEIGCGSVDFNLDMQSSGKEGSVYTRDMDSVLEYYAALGKKARDLGLMISQTHGRMRGYSFDRVQDEMLLRDAAIDMAATKMLGAPYCVIHSITNIHVGFERDAEELIAKNTEMYRDILPYAKENGIVMALETFGDATDREGRNDCDFFGYPENLLATYNALIEKHGAEGSICICMDTGHTNKAKRFDNPSAGELIRVLGSRIKILHLNDNDGVMDQHKIPYMGTIDWDEVFTSLKETGYDGVYNMELHLDEYGKSMEMMKETGHFAVSVLREALKRY